VKQIRGDKKIKGNAAHRRKSPKRGENKKGKER